MNKTKFLTIASIILLVANLLLAAALFMKKPPPPRPRDIIIKELQFSPEQVTAFEKLIDQHKELFEEKKKQLMEKKRALHRLLTPSKSIKDEQMLASEIGALQKDIELIQFRHFEDIKALCKTEQLPDFNRLMNDIGHIFQTAPPKKHK